MEMLRRENEVLKRLVEDSDGTVERLKTLPEDEALALFHRFRTAAGEHSNNVSGRLPFFCPLSFYTQKKSPEQQQH